MLKRLRIQLTILYILAALGLAALISAGAYFLLNYYFHKQTDMALNYKMALTFKQYNIPLTPELTQAEQDYLSREAPQLPLPTLSHTPVVNASDQDDDDEEKSEKESRSTSETHEESESESEDRYDSQLGPIYVLQLDAQGNVLTSPSPANFPIGVSQEAKQAALVHGYDLRTIRSNTGEPTRLLTYRVDNLGNQVVLQIGRSLADQERIRYQFLLGLIGLGASASVLLGLGSWWLSGQSLIPAQRSWDQQMTFISNASHELRTPLTLIQASTEAIQRSQSATDEEQNQLIEDILSECNYMDHLIADLLLLSRLDTHRIKFDLQSINLPEFLGETKLQAKKLLGDRAIAIELGPVQGSVRADPNRLRQVLLILLDNAIRYTQNGGAIYLEAYSRNRFCQVIVRDNGIGISPEHLPHVFDRFYQARPTSEGDVRSNGLGLSIARGIVFALGGNIHLESQLNQGTRVILELPSTAKQT